MQNFYYNQNNNEKVHCALRINEKYLLYSEAGSGDREG